MLNTKVSRGALQQGWVPKNGQALSGGFNKEPYNHCDNSLGHSLQVFCTILYAGKEVGQT